MDKQQKQKIREEREAQLMSQNIAARILAQKTVKYFTVAATMKRLPRRLEKLNIWLLRGSLNVRDIKYD